MLQDNIKNFLGNTTRVFAGGLIGAVFDILISQSKRIAELEERTYGLEYKVRRLEDNH